jgi:hypothetical protein
MHAEGISTTHRPTDRCINIFIKVNADRHIDFFGIHIDSFIECEIAHRLDLGTGKIFKSNFICNLDSNVKRFIKTFKHSKRIRDYLYTLLGINPII